MKTTIKLEYASYELYTKKIGDSFGSGWICLNEDYQNESSGEYDTEELALIGAQANATFHHGATFCR